MNIYCSIIRRIERMLVRIGTALGCNGDVCLLACSSSIVPLMRRQVHVTVTTSLRWAIYLEKRNKCSALSPWGSVHDPRRSNLYAGHHLVSDRLRRDKPQDSSATSLSARKKYFSPPGDLRRPREVFRGELIGHRLQGQRSHDSDQAKNGLRCWFPASRNHGHSQMSRPISYPFYGGEGNLTMLCGPKKVCSRRVSGYSSACSMYMNVSNG